MGDFVLATTASRLRECVRETDVVARLGGDEFVVVLANLNQRHEVGRLAQKLVRLLSRPIIVDRRMVQVGASVGVAIFPDDGASIDALAQRADGALYAAKEGGRNTFRFFEGAAAGDQ